jgi:hypothetical protein
MRFHAVMMALARPADGDFHGLAAPAAHEPGGCAEDAVASPN